MVLFAKLASTFTQGATGAAISDPLAMRINKFSKVRGFQFMSSDAQVLVPLVLLFAKTTCEIRGVSNWLQMIWIYTGTIAAKMIEFQSVRDWAAMNFVQKAVSLSRTLPVPQSSITFRRSAVPVPASCYAINSKEGSSTLDNRFSVGTIVFHRWMHYA